VGAGLEVEIMSLSAITRVQVFTGVSAQLIIVLSKIIKTWGENFGSSFSSAMSLLSLPSRCQMRVEEVQVTFGKSQTILWLVSIILQLRLKIGNGNWSYWTDVYGGNNANGTLSSFVVPDGENIKTVLMRSGARIDRLQFITDNGTRSQVFGGIFHND